MNKTIWITGDQCSFDNSALKAFADQRDTVCILMIESVERGRSLKYHKKKLVLIYAIMRHFAEELRADGWLVDYYHEQPSFESALKVHLKTHEPEKFFWMEQSEYGADTRLRELVQPLPVQILPHCNFISNSIDFERLHTSPEARVTMERFYRVMRRKTKLLMDGDEPVGGQWNYDKENRQPPGKGFDVQPIRAFPADKITASVIEMVEKHFADHPGTTTGWRYAVTRNDALIAATDFFETRFKNFGPHQDAMLYGQPFLNHSLLSPYLNTCLLKPMELCIEAEKKFRRGEVELPSAEGFIRQIIGWREFIWRVYWRLMPAYKQRNALSAEQALPEFFWTGRTEMRCLADVIASVIEHGYAHHIARLMLLGNFALLAGLDPLQTNDWFSSMFVDAYDWVMVPNVIGMTLHADGGYVGTKPYAAAANYINKMSNYCAKCYYDPRQAIGKRACPFNALYWDFLRRNQDYLEGNPRMNMQMRALSAKDPELLKAMSEQVRFLLGHERERE